MRDGYGIFENEAGEWFIDTPDQIYGSYDALDEAKEELERAYPEVIRYAIIHYSEMTEWTWEWVEEDE